MCLAVDQEPVHAEQLRLLPLGTISGIEWKTMWSAPCRSGDHEARRSQQHHARPDPPRREPTPPSWQGSQDVGRGHCGAPGLLTDSPRTRLRRATTLRPMADAELSTWRAIGMACALHASTPRAIHMLSPAQMSTPRAIGMPCEEQLSTPLGIRMPCAEQVSTPPCIAMPRGEQVSTPRGNDLGRRQYVPIACGIGMPRGVQLQLQCM